MAGLTSTGFDAKTLAEITEAVQGRLRGFFGSGVDTVSDSVIMNLINPILIEVQENWEDAQLNYDFFNPGNAEGIALDNIGAITNTPRLSGAKSTVVVQALGIEGAVIPINFIRAVDPTGDRFQTTEAQTLPATGSQPLEFTMTALEDGETAAVAGTLTVGALPAGVTSITNAVDATLGSVDETDELYRVGRKSRLAAVGAGTVVAIKAALLAITTPSAVTSAFIFENDTDIADASYTPALPPHSIRALVLGGSDQSIIDVLGTKKGAGTYTDGTTSGTYTDPTDGQTFPIRFSRVTQSNIYVTVTITSKSSEYPATGDADIEAAILALTWEVGEDVTLPKLQNAVTDTLGIITYALYFDTSASPSTDTAIVIAAGYQADFDSSRTTVTS